jgi:hypothetical protein
VRSLSPLAMVIAMVGPGVIGGLAILTGLPALLVLVLVAGAAGFFVAHPGGGRATLSAFAGSRACFVALLGVGAPFVPSLVSDADFRQAALGVIGLPLAIVLIVLGLGALVGYAGAYVGRDVARRTATK